MMCEIFKGRRKSDTYLYVESPADFERVPESIRNLMGELEKVMDLEIVATTKLARENPQNVLANIGENGFHIQLPPKDEIPDIL